MRLKRITNYTDNGCETVFINAEKINAVACDVMEIKNNLGRYRYRVLFMMDKGGTIEINRYGDRRDEWEEWVGELMEEEQPIPDTQQAEEMNEQGNTSEDYKVEMDEELRKELLVELKKYAAALKEKAWAGETVPAISVMVIDKAGHVSVVGLSAIKGANEAFYGELLTRPAGVRY